MTSLKPTSRGNLGRFIIFIPVGSSYILLTYLVENPALTLKAQGKEVELKSSRQTGLLLHLQDQTSLNKFYFLMLKLGETTILKTLKWSRLNQVKSQKITIRAVCFWICTKRNFAKRLRKPMLSALAGMYAERGSKSCIEGTYAEATGRLCRPHVLPTRAQQQ